jgi:hypothetical protein
MESVMSVLFNLLLFVGVFYLILRVPEPGDQRTRNARTASDNPASARKVA